MSEPAKVNQKKILKISGIVLGGIMAFFIITTIILLAFLEPIAEKYIKRQVAEQTDGLYSLEFDAISLDVFTRTATFQNLRLYPDTSLYQNQIESGTASSSVLEVAAPTLKIAHINILDVVFRDKINIGAIILDQPQIAFYMDGDVMDQGSEQQEGRKSLDQMFESIHIKEIHVNEANFQQILLGQTNRARHEVPYASLLIDDFKIDFSDHDDQNGQDPEYHVKNIQLSIKNYSYVASDSVHTIDVSLFAYSSRTKELLAEGLLINADHQINKGLPLKDAHPIVVNLDVRHLRISGLDIISAFQTGNLIIEDIEVEKPIVQLLENHDIPSSDEMLSTADLYNEFSGLIEEAVVGTFKLQGGILNYQMKSDGTISDIHKLENLNLVLHNLQIDSSAIFNSREHFIFNDAHATAEKYAFFHPLSPYTIEAGDIVVSSIDQAIQVNAIKVIGDWQKNQALKQRGLAKEVVFNFTAQQLLMSDMDLIKAFKTSRLKIGNITMEQPAIDVLIDISVHTQKEGSDLKEIFDAVSNYITEVVIEEIKIEDASFTQHLLKANKKIRQVQKLEHANLVARGISMDSTYIYQQEQNIPLENLRLIANQYTYFTPDEIHTFTLGSVSFSSREQELTARSINVKHDREANNNLKQDGDAHRNLYSVFARKFRVKGLDLINAVNTGRFAVGQIILYEPELDILLDRNVSPSPSEEIQEDILDDLFSLFNPVSVDSLNLIGGVFTFHEKRDEVIRTHLLEHASATIIGLHLSADEMEAEVDDVFPFQDVILIAKDYSYRSPDQIYSIKMDSMKYSSKLQFLSANFIDVKSDKEENERIKRANLSEANRNLLDVSADKFRISGLDLLHAYETGEFVMEEVLLEDPELVIHQDRNVPEKRREGVGADNEFMGQIADVVETFSIGQLFIRNGAVQVYSLLDALQREHRIEHVSVTVDSLRLVSLVANDPLEMFKVADMEVVVQDYDYVLPDSLYVFKVGEVRSSLGDQTILIDDLRLVPLFTIDEYPDRLEFVDDRFDIQVSDIQIQEIDLIALFNNQDIILQKAVLNKAMIDVYRDDRLERDPDRRPMTLQNMLRRLGMYFKADSIFLEDARLTFSSIPPNGEEPVILILDEIHLEIANVTNDSALIRENNLAEVQASAQLMGESQLELNIQLDLDHTEDLYAYQGSLESMQFKALNPLFENLMPIRLEDGTINKVEFSVTATEHIAQGDMYFFYNDLEIILKNRNDPENPNFWLRTGTWLLNNFLIKSHNPTQRGKLREGGIEVERDYEKSVFNHMGEAMIDGISSSIMTPFVERVVDVFVGD